MEQQIILASGSRQRKFYKLTRIFIIVISLMLMIIGLGYLEKSGRHWHEYTTCLSNFDKNNETDYFDRKNTDRPCQAFVNSYLNNEDVSFDLMKVGFWLPVIFFGGVILKKIALKYLKSNNKLFNKKIE